MAVPKSRHGVCWFWIEVSGGRVRTTCHQTAGNNCICCFAGPFCQRPFVALLGPLFSLLPKTSQSCCLAAQQQLFFSRKCLALVSQRNLHQEPSLLSTLDASCRPGSKSLNRVPDKGSVLSQGSLQGLLEWNYALFYSILLITFLTRPRSQRSPGQQTAKWKNNAKKDKIQTYFKRF